MLILLTLRFGKKVWIKFEHILAIKPRFFFKGAKIIMLEGVSVVVRELPNSIVENTVAALKGVPKDAKEGK